MSYQKFRSKLDEATEAVKDLVVRKNFEQSLYTLESDEIWETARGKLYEATRLANRLEEGEKRAALNDLNFFRAANTSYLNRLQ